MLPDKLAFVDIETTGSSPRFGRMIEIGIVRVEEGIVTKTYNTLINPQTHLPPEIEMLTGITHKDLEGKPTFKQIKNDILEMLVDCVFVAHNVRFDYSFLRHEYSRENIDFRLRHFCTVRLSRALYPHEKHHNLDALIERFGFTCANRHRAFDDAKILWDFYQRAKLETKEAEFIKAVSVALRRPNVPIKLTEEHLDSLPEQPGVYIFYGVEPTITQDIQINEPPKDQEVKKRSISDIANNLPKTIPLYIGKSIDIKDRVLSHFSSDLYSLKEMNIVQQVTSIETIPTAGELGALFLESKLIKKLLPLYNRVLRNKRELIGLTKHTDKNGYTVVALETLQFINAKNLDDFLGFFRSKRDAKTYLADLAKRYSLCEKLLGIEKTTSACFGYRLGRCKGACIGKEASLFYNLRHTTAFYKTRIRPWPFNGPIIIEETNNILGIKEHFLIDKWCYLGNVKSEDKESINNFDALNFETDYQFDLDIYKIIYRFLNKKDNLDKIRVVDKSILYPDFSTKNLSH